MKKSVICFGAFSRLPGLRTAGFGDCTSACKVSHAQDFVAVLASVDVVSCIQALLTCRSSPF